jgi:hypothetical protein
MLEQHSFRRQGRYERLVSVFERDEIADAVDALLAYLDAKQGDTDLEETGIEDSFMLHASPFLPGGAGCPVADEGGGNVTDEPHDGDGDDQDGNGSEDDFMYHGWQGAAGCPIADPGGCEHDGRELGY